MWKRLSFVVGLLLIIGHVQLESGELYYRLFGTKVIYPLIDFNSSPEWYRKNGIRIEWWIKIMSDDILWMLTYFVLVIVAKKYSRKLFLICSVFLGYHIFDHFMMWYNYRQSHLLYWLELLADTICLIILIFVRDKKQAIVKSIT